MTYTRPLFNLVNASTVIVRASSKGAHACNDSGSSSGSTQGAYEIDE